ncbi:hypothetical protein AAFF_G00107100 [Aldrovandia affinis]|uniref:Uncharacterized protein n=1 Tax=Aldrovandia affinis TaxID=143900 RepID=A0AAD7WY16_9TELE|nr:hypothetical protein AAFF_G00107100 [Aldrovandia affinis]
MNEGAFFRPITTLLWLSDGQHIHRRDASLPSVSLRGSTLTRLRHTWPDSLFRAAPIRHGRHRDLPQFPLLERSSCGVSEALLKRRAAVVKEFCEKDDKRSIIGRPRRCLQNCPVAREQSGSSVLA